MFYLIVVWADGTTKVLREFKRYAHAMRNFYKEFDKYKNLGVFEDTENTCGFCAMKETEMGLSYFELPECLKGIVKQ